MPLTKKFRASLQVQLYPGAQVMCTISSFPSLAFFLSLLVLSSGSLSPTSYPMLTIQQHPLRYPEGRQLLFPGSSCKTLTALPWYVPTPGPLKMEDGGAQPVLDPVSYLDPGELCQQQLITETLCGGGFPRDSWGL